MARARVALPRRGRGTRCEVMLLRARSRSPRRAREAVRESVPLFSMSYGFNRFEFECDEPQYQAQYWPHSFTWRWEYAI